MNAMNLVSASRFLIHLEIFPMCLNKAAKQINNLTYFPAQTLDTSDWMEPLVTLSSWCDFFTVVFLWRTALKIISLWYWLDFFLPLINMFFIFLCKLGTTMQLVFGVKVMYQVCYLFWGPTVLNGLKSTHWMELFPITPPR